ncbi:hypothetical protein [Methanococcoides methylutens]|uniref:Uncharacterized protein n=1 Tax=Methanococcoides methylutens MM1 TaxID=1434104 RepID=A0A0E3X1A1_METMT|nr:hypothetical protein [Methanococcoides methylutens]AKB86199.1 hypothetical protein MCMEM_2146 [Methanococcoides methylutens MM1]
MEKRNKPKGNQNKIWKIILIIASIAFLIVAGAMIIIDQRYYIGILYLITSILYFSSAYLIATGRANIIKGTSTKQMSLVLGFVIIAIGLALNGPLWGLGFVLFLAAILSIQEDTK